MKFAISICIRLSNKKINKIEFHIYRVEVQLLRVYFSTFFAFECHSIKTN